jgi:hypothetical protein
MKKTIFLLVLLVGGFTFINGQNVVEVDANATFVGYANVFELPANGGGYAFGQPWGVPELKTVVDPAGGTITLQPNFNTYGDNPTDPFWVNQSTGEGNKIFEGNTYVEDASLVGSELTFNGGVVSYTLDAEYAAVAFIKVFNANFSVVKEETAEMVAGENFSVVYTNVEPEDAWVQYGFQVVGVNANPADEPTLGSVVVSAPILGVNDVNNVNVSIYPNPVSERLNINSTSEITSVVVYNILGAKVQSITPNSTSVTMNLSGLTPGVYLTTINTNTGTKTVNIVKK